MFLQAAACLKGLFLLLFALIVPPPPRKKAQMWQILESVALMHPSAHKKLLVSIGTWITSFQYENLDLSTPHRIKLNWTSSKPRSSVYFEELGGEALACLGKQTVFLFSSHPELNARSLHPIDRAVSGEHSRWSGSLYCSSLFHTCRWSLSPLCPGCGSIWADRGTTPGAGCMCRDRAAISP